MRRLLVLDPFSEGHIARIKEVAGPEFEVKQITVDSDNQNLKEELKTAEVVLGMPDISLLQNPEKDCPKLKFIQMSWAGTDHYTRNTLSFPAGKISLSNGSGAYGMVMSQFIIGLTLSSMLNFKAYHRQQTEKVWERRGPIQSLDHAKVLIFGAGDIGSATAKRLQGFDAYTIGVCRDKNKYRPFFDKLCTLDEAEAFLPDVDVVIGCIPNSEESQGYFDERRLGLLKKDAIIVNVGRGNFIDCMALNELLSNGQLWGAALDVTNPEPLPPDHPLWDNPRCIITPHASGATFGSLPETTDLLCDIVCDNISRYIAGKELNNRIF